MATIPTQIRIDATIKKQATELFSTLGLDMSSAVNIFLSQCVLKGGLPFMVEIPQYSTKVLEAMQEARHITAAPNVPSYTDMNSLKQALEE